MSSIRSLAYGAVKIAITHPYSWPDVRRGAERITAETARALAGRGHEVTFLTAGSTAGRDETAGYVTIRHRRIFADAVRHERWFAARAASALVRMRFDVVHSFMPYDSLAAIRTRRLTGHRTVYQELGNPYRLHWAGLRDRRARRRVLRAVDVYACMSHFSLGVLEAEWGRIGDLIPGGVRLSQFTPVADRADAPTILFSAALTDPAKRLDLLLEALALLARRVPDVRLWLSGPGDASALLTTTPAAARDRTQVLPLGGAEEQGDRYARAWVTVLPTETDSFGLVLVESLACGTPIVVTDRGAPPELVSPSVGAICAPGDPQSLADALASGLELSRQPQTAACCRARAADFDWDDAIAPLLERLYSDVTGAASGSGPTPPT